MVRDCTTCYYRFKEVTERCMECYDENLNRHTNWQPNLATKFNMEVSMKEKALEEEKECCEKCACGVHENENGDLYIDVEDLMSRQITLELSEKEIGILLNKAVVDILNDAIKKHDAEIEEWKEEG